jgi:hypothetical protein
MWTVDSAARWLALSCAATALTACWQSWVSESDPSLWLAVRPATSWVAAASSSSEQAVCPSAWESAEANWLITLRIALVAAVEDEPAACGVKPTLPPQPLSTAAAASAASATRRGVVVLGLRTTNSLSVARDYPADCLSGGRVQRCNCFGVSRGRLILVGMREDNGRRGGKQSVSWTLTTARWGRCSTLFGMLWVGVAGAPA